MTTTLYNPNYSSKSSDTPTTPATASFDEFAQSRANASNNSANITAIDTNEKPNLSTSFAIPSNVSIIEYLKKRAEPITNKFMLAPPSASTINIRRNSTQQAAAVAVAAASGGSNQSSATQRQSIGGNTTTEASSSTRSEAPPPIPKRTFLDKIIQSSLSESSTQSPTSTIKTTINNVCKQTLDEVKRRNTSVKPPINQNQTVQRRLVENHYPIDQYSDDDRLSIESSVFEEPKSSDPIISLSNRSSSDSNKSQTTIDTGYMSASNDNDRIFFGASEDFRSRFSSVDTQSSIDSCTSSDLQTQQSFTLQNQARCIISPLAVKRDEYDDKMNNPTQMHGKTFSRFNSSNSLLSVSNKTINSNSSNSIKNQSIASNASAYRVNSLNANRNQSMPKSIDTVGVTVTNGLNQSGKMRPVPSPAASRTQNSLDSGRILYNGSMLGAFQTGLAKITSAAATTGRRSFKKASQIAHTKLTQRQDSSISNDSFSLNSSSSYNTKNFDATQVANNSNNRNNNRTTSCLNGQELTNFDRFSTNKYHFPTGRSTFRQDSTISNDSFSQTSSSPSYNTKQCEQPLLAHTAKIHAMKQHLKCADEITKENFDNSANSAIIKSASTPASLQAVVRFQNGSNMSLQHKVINRRKSSNPYITRGILKFRLLQILLNALALLIIAGGLAAYFKAYPTVKFVNKTIFTPQRPAPSAITPIKELAKKQIITSPFDKNPAPGICLPIIVKFCQNHQVQYNYTIYPNYIGHFSQIEAEEDLEPYEAIVDVQCYELASLFLCTLFVPKCGTAGLIPPCKSLCLETMRRCHFFFNVFGLELPDYLSCHQFSDSNNPDICVGQKQMRDAYNRALKPVCSGFSCDNKTRCIPLDWKCDGNVDCLDQSDESNCDKCGNDTIYCGENRCMSSQHVCDGHIDCPYGQDERNCVRLSERNGDLGKGILEIYKVNLKKWVPACISNWNPITSPTMVCSLLGYSSVNTSRITMRNTNQTLTPNSTKDPNNIARMYQRKKTNLIKEFGSCSPNENHPVIDLTCSNYECGRARNRPARARTRIVGGSESSPGDWPFLAAILGGPEEVFYCAGVLIADQWVLTASHCIGNKSLHNINSWTIQLGITRRNSHTYYGQKVKVQRVLPHPQYNLDVMHDNDIALFQLATRVAFHEHLLPVCLPPPSLKRIKPGTICTVIGWGKTKEDKKPSTSYEPTVNEVNVPVLNRDLCNEWLVHLNVTDGMICAGYSEGGKDACQGDSGGPLLCRDSNDRERYYVAGIVSWGVKCANPKLPGVYANVPKYIPWIIENIQNYSNVPLEYPRSNINRKPNKMFNRQHRQKS